MNDDLKFINAGDYMTFRDEPFAEIGANKSCTASYQYSHNVNLTLQRQT